MVGAWAQVYLSSRVEVCVYDPARTSTQCATTLSTTATTTTTTKMTMTLSTVVAEWTVHLSYLRQQGRLEWWQPANRSVVDGS